METQPFGNAGRPIGTQLDNVVIQHRSGQDYAYDALWQISLGPGGTALTADLS